MKRYFYPTNRLHHAICMSIDFGMRFESEHGEPLTAIGGGFFWGNGGGYAGPAYVRADCLPLLEPKAGDIGNRGRDLYEHKYGTWEFGGGYSSLDPELHRDVQIILRDGTSFHWPESEAA